MGVPEILPRETKHGLVADGDGWFVLNAAESRWNDTGPFGFYCNFEGKRGFRQLGLNLNVLEPGQSLGFYHRRRTFSSSPASACCWSRARSERCAPGTSCTARPRRIT